MADPKITIKVEGSGLPGGGADGQVLTRRDGKPIWGDLDVRQEALRLLIDMGIAPMLFDADGSALADGDGALLATT